MSRYVQAVFLPIVLEGRRDFVMVRGTHIDIFGLVYIFYFGIWCRLLIQTAKGSFGAQRRSCWQLESIFRTNKFLRDSSLGWVPEECNNISCLRWRHNGRDGISNHQPRDCLHNLFFGRRSKKTSKLRVTGLCVGNSPGTGEFPTQRASNAENVPIWWRHQLFSLLLT